MKAQFVSPYLLHQILEEDQKQEGASEQSSQPHSPPQEQHLQQQLINIS